MTSTLDEKPPLSLTEQLIVAAQQYKNAAKAELEQFRSECAQELNDAINDASLSLIARGNATGDNGMLIKVATGAGSVEYAPAAMVGTTTDAAIIALEDVDFAAWPVNARGEYMLVPEEQLIVLELLGLNSVYIRMPAETLVAKLVTRKNIKRVKEGKGKFKRIIDELELLSCPNHK